MLCFANLACFVFLKHPFWDSFYFAKCFQILITLIKHNDWEKNRENRVAKNTDLYKLTLEKSIAIHKQHIKYDFGVPLITKTLMDKITHGGFVFEVRPLQFHSIFSPPIPRKYRVISEAYLELSQISTLELFCENSFFFQPLTIIAKKLHRRCSNGF